VGTADEVFIRDFAAVSGGRSFELAPRSWANPIPDEVKWLPLVGDPLETAAASVQP